MSGTTDLRFLLQNASPRLNPGTFVFCTVGNLSDLDFEELVFTFKEKEGITVVISQEKADALQLRYEFLAAWITLDVVSSLEAVGLTAAFSTLLAENGITCNVVAGYYHDHLFVKQEDQQSAIELLQALK